LFWVSVNEVWELWVLFQFLFPIVLLAEIVIKVFKVIGVREWVVLLLVVLQLGGLF